MREELISKRYVKPLLQMCDSSTYESLIELFDSLAAGFNDVKFAHIIASGDISINQKRDILLDIVKPAQSNIIDNFIKILAENNRLELIPFIAKEIKRQIGAIRREYSGFIYSKDAIEQGTIDTIASDLGKKMDSKINLTYVASDYDGIRVEVDGLNVEINFSKTRLNSQLVEHILKAI